LGGHAAPGEDRPGSSKGVGKTEIEERTKKGDNGKTKPRRWPNVGDNRG